MAEEVKNVITDAQIDEAVKRVEELKNARTEVTTLQDELAVHQKDLAEAEKIYGVSSKQYELQKEHVTLTESKIADAEKKVADLSYKQSELKPILDELAKKFEVAYKADGAKEYHIAMAPVKEDGKTTEGDGKKVYKQLLDYLYHNVTFTPKNAVNLMVLVRNMEENKAWVNSKEFDNVIILRSASVLSLWRFIMEELTGKGFYEARTFLQCWANCGDAVSTAIREIQKDNAATRKLGSDLTAMEEEFNRSENDIPADEQQMTTQEEVAPEVAE